MKLQRVTVGRHLIWNTVSIEIIDGGDNDSFFDRK